MAPSRAAQREAWRGEVGRRLRTVQALAEQTLKRYASSAGFRPLRDEPEIAGRLEQLRQDAAMLAAAPRVRIGAARRVQGARSRRASTAERLFAACAEVRARIARQYRGPRHDALRRALGQGHPASAAKPQTLISFADLILSAQSAYQEALRSVRVGPPTFARIARLRAELVAVGPEGQDLQRQRRLTLEALLRCADRARAICAELDEMAAALRDAAMAGEGEEESHA